jgi:hypothetical protein
MCTCLFWVCAVLCLGRGLATSWSLIQGVLPSVKWSWNWKRNQKPGPKGAAGPAKNQRVAYSRRAQKVYIIIIINFGPYVVIIFFEAFILVCLSNFIRMWIRSILVEVLLTVIRATKKSVDYLYRVSFVVVLTSCILFLTTWFPFQIGRVYFFRN